MKTNPILEAKVREKEKAEALKRMAILQLHPNVIRDFRSQDKLNLSEGYGALYWLNDEQKAIIAQAEEEYDITIYHIIHNKTKFGELLACLYVSQYPEEWELDRQDLQEHCPIAYVINLDEPAFSEFGSIGIEQQFGGLVRTA